MVEQRAVIIVELIDKAYAVTFFEKKLGIQGDEKGITELTAVLKFMPLAIVQVAVYIA